MTCVVSGIACSGITSRAYTLKQFYEICWHKCSQEAPSMFLKCLIFSTIVIHIDTVMFYLSCKQPAIKLSILYFLYDLPKLYVLINNSIGKERVFETGNISDLVKWYFRQTKFTNGLERLYVLGNFGCCKI